MDGIACIRHLRMDLSKDLACFARILRGQAPRRLGAFNISLVSDLPRFIVTPDKR